MLDSLRELDWAPRDMRRQLKQVEAVKRPCGTAAAAPTESEVAKKLGIEINRWQKMMGRCGLSIGLGPSK
jgi:RNA polymerase sigma factor for flagellar operon FliA